MCLASVLIDLDNAEGSITVSSKSLSVELGLVNAPSGAVAWLADGAESGLGVQVTETGVESHPVDEVVRGLESP